MLVRLLGPVDVLVDGAPRSVPGARGTAILAALALQPGVIVSADRLVDIVWGDGAPASAAKTLQSHVSRLRRVLGDGAVILARSPGYVLKLDGEGTDVRAAERLIRDSAVGDLRDRESQLRAAIELWRGRPLADLAGTAWFDDHARRLEDLLLRTRLPLVDTRLAIGQHAELVPEVEQLSRQHPLDERIHRQLMLALYRAGRQSEALAVYQRLRRTLDDELGIDPSQPLRDLETAILRQDPALDALPPVPPPPAPALGAVPAQLPLAVAGFSGRTRELAYLDGLLPDADGAGPTPAAVVISAISGTAGVGKTTLAVHWAHRVAGRFPDGQLYVNLRGFDPAGLAVDPASAVHGFLHALGVPADRIPADLDARAGLYRSMLAGKRILVVLDNARDAEQIRPLLPGTPGCFAIVTSRNHHAPLVATEAARPLTLDLLSTVEAHDLLTRRLGADRVTAEPDAVEEIITHCARLPLALAVIAARAASNPHFPLATLAAQLRKTASALDALSAGDPNTDVRTVFSWSYRMMTPDAARLFRLIGLHPGPDISAPAAASLAGIPLDRVRTLLADLARAHLLTEDTPGRYGCHDLLRAYAAEQAEIRDSDDTRRAAIQRMLDHYLHTTHTAVRLLHPSRDSIPLAASQPGVIPEGLDSYDGALDWCTAEHSILLALVQQAAATGFDSYAWRLSWALRTFLLRRGLWQEQVTTEYAGLAAARRIGDRAGQASALCGLALGLVRSGRLGDADTRFRQALQAYAELGDAAGQANIHTALAEIAEKQGRPADSLRHIELALELYRAEGHRPGQARALNGLGWSHSLLGDHRQALAYCTQALHLLEELGDRDGQATTWDSLGYAHRGLAEYEQAANCYQHAIDMYREVGDRYWEADALSGLGETHLAAGDLDTARTTWRQALHILDTLNHPDAERLRARLRPVPAGSEPAPVS